MDQQGSYTTLTGGFGKLSSVQLSAISYSYQPQLSAQRSWFLGSVEMRVLPTLDQALPDCSSTSRY